MENQRLFIGNLSYQTTKEEIVTLFSAYGTVETISLRPKKGFGFVAMSTPEEAMAALANLDQIEFKSRPLRINLELPRNKARKMTLERRKQLEKQHSP